MLFKWARGFGLRVVLGYQILLIAALCLIATPPAHAQYPDRTITMVVNYAAGGATDIFARLLAEELTKRLGQSVIVKNMGGAGGGLGALEVIRSPADGYTLLFSTNILNVERGLKLKPRFEVSKDFVPITLLASTNISLLARKDAPFSTIQEFIAYGQANKGKLNYGSSGVGATGQILAAYLSALTDTDLVHIPFTGNAPALNALMGGQIDLLWNDVGASVPYVEEGKVKMIALAGAAGSAVAPNVPTVAASGFPQFDYDFQLGVFAPAGTPPDIVAKLHREIVASVRGSRMESTLKARGYQIIGNTPAEYLALMNKETETWATAIERAKIERQ